MAWDLNNTILNQSRTHLNYRKEMKLKKLIAVVGGILLLMGIMAGSAFTDVLIQYKTTIREFPVS